jgi:hypothetical protein
MTDSTDEPTTPVRKPRKPKTSGRPESPPAAGVAAPVALQGVDPVADLPFESAPLADTAEPASHDHPHDHGDGAGHSHEPEKPGMLNGIIEGVRGLFKRGDKSK